MPVTSSNAATGSVVGTPRRQYVSINAFNNEFYTYTTSTDFTDGQFVTTGSLTPVSGATAANCPAGRVLRENGKKLFPSANPGVETFLVGVYDSTTFLNGFIDPNCRLFQPQSTDLPTYLPNPVDYQGAETTDLGPGVYTRGDVVTTDGNIAYEKDISGAPYGGIYTDEGDLNPYFKIGNAIEVPGKTVYNQVTLDGSNGNITYTGLLEPRESASGEGYSVGRLNTGTGGGSDQHVSTINRLLSRGAVAIISRAETLAGTPGQLTWAITNSSTLTISSSEVTDRYVCHYLLISNFFD